jgi:lipopolysaccharide export system protein LptA
MKLKIVLLLLIACNSIFAQTNPAITSWLQNTNNTKGRYYLTGNSTPINTTIDANVQQVQYSTNYVYVTATGVPAFVTGPFATGPVSKALNNNYIFKLPFNTERLHKLTESYVVCNKKIIKALGKPLPVSSKDGLLKTFHSFTNND